MPFVHVTLLPAHTIIICTDVGKSNANKKTHNFREMLRQHAHVLPITCQAIVILFSSNCARALRVIIMDLVLLYVTWTRRFRVFGCSIFIRHRGRFIRVGGDACWLVRVFFFSRPAINASAIAESFDEHFPLILVRPMLASCVSHYRKDVDTFTSINEVN